MIVPHVKRRENFLELEARDEGIVRYILGIIPKDETIVKRWVEGNERDGQYDGDGPYEILSRGTVRPMPGSFRLSLHRFYGVITSSSVVIQNGRKET